MKAIFGRRLASSEESKEQLSVLTGLPVLGLDAMASTGYGPEAALTILTPLGLSGLHYFPFIALAVVATLTTLYMSYRQTAEAYPGGGGAYNVTSDNLGAQPGVWAAVALIIDYLLNVAVAISAGMGTVVSAVPVLQPYALALCLAVLFTLMFVNLRGVRESGIIFVFPVFLFVGCISIAIAIGIVHVLLAGGHPHPAISPPPIPPTTAAVSPWLLLAAFANGCTAMTGIEAVSNGVPLFRKPKVPNAHRTLTAIFVILSLFLLALGYLCPAYHIGAMDEQKPGYQTILTQMIAAVAGKGVFYYIASISIFIVLTYSAQTSFAGFPRVCRFLAEDRFLPLFFANRGRRLVYTPGIIILTVISAALLIAFDGVTEKLIPLFAVGAFAAFLLSQTSMVLHWLRKPGPGTRLKLVFNAVGAVTTAVALVIIIAAKFVDGAWVTIIVVPGLVFLLNGIRNHYKKVATEVQEPFAFKPDTTRPSTVVIPIEGWDRAAEKALQFGLLLSTDIIALHVVTEKDDKARIRKLWKEKVERPAEQAGLPIPRLKIIDSPYRLIYAPILDFVGKLRQEQPDSTIAVIIPELIEPHWYEHLLHNVYRRRLQSLLYEKRDAHTIVINAPWYLRDV